MNNSADNPRDAGMSEGTCLSCLGMDVRRDVAGCPDQLEIVVGRHTQHEVDAADHIAVHAAMPGNDAEPAVAGWHVNAVLAQPDVDVVNRVVRIAELNRKRQAINPCVIKRNA